MALIAWVFAAKPVVVQTASLLERATALQPEIETPSVVKLTVPVAPGVTAAVRDTDAPVSAELADRVNVVADAVPGLTSTLGSDRSEYPWLFWLWMETKKSVPFESEVIVQDVDVVFAVQDLTEDPPTSALKAVTTVLIRAAPLVFGAVQLISTEPLPET